MILKCFTLMLLIANGICASLKSDISPLSDRNKRSSQLGYGSSGLGLGAGLGVSSMNAKSASLADVNRLIASLQSANAGAQNNLLGSSAYVAGSSSLANGLYGGLGSAGLNSGLALNNLNLGANSPYGSLAGGNSIDQALAGLRQANYGLSSSGASGYGAGLDNTALTGGKKSRMSPGLAVSKGYGKSKASLNSLGAASLTGGLGGLSSIGASGLAPTALSSGLVANNLGVGLGLNNMMTPDVASAAALGLGLNNMMTPNVASAAALGLGLNNMMTPDVASAAALGLGGLAGLGGLDGTALAYSTGLYGRFNEFSPAAAYGFGRPVGGVYAGPYGGMDYSNFGAPLTGPFKFPPYKGNRIQKIFNMNRKKMRSEDQKKRAKELGEYDSPETDESQSDYYYDDNLYYGDELNNNQENVDKKDKIDSKTLRKKYTKN